MWRRWTVRLIAAVAYCAFLMAGATIFLSTLMEGWEGFRKGVGTVFLPGEWVYNEGWWWILCGGPAIVMVATQWLFLVPVGFARPKDGTRSRSLTLSIAMIAIVVAALTAGLIYAVGEAIILARGGNDVLEVWGPQESGPVWRQTLGWFIMPYFLVPITWLLWLPVLMIFARRAFARGRWGRVVGLLLGGTILEVLIVIPLDVMVRRRTDCYCGTGSFLSIALSTFAFVWLVGPGIIIPLTSTRRRLWAESHCLNCGYAKGPKAGRGSECPECGQSWLPKE